MRSLQVGLIALVAVFGVALRAQDVQHYREELVAAEAMPRSVDKDSVIIHNLCLLAETLAGREDSTARAYLERVDRIRSETQWSKADGLYFRALGTYHDRRGEYQEALDAYSSSIDAFNEVNDKSEYISYAYIRKAFVLSNNGLFEEGKTYLKEIEPVTRQLGNKDCLAFILDAYGDYLFYSYFGQQDYAKALEYYKQVEEILPEVQRAQIKADNAHCLAGCYLRLDEESLAFEYIDKALEIATDEDIPSVIFAVYGDLADYYEEQGDFASAIPYRKQSLDYAKKVHWIEMESRGEKNLAYTYKAAGDFVNALAHFERWKIIEDSVSRFSVQQRYAELETKYESGKKDLEIEQLKGENLRLWRNVLIFGLIAVIGFVIYSIRINARLKRQNGELQRKNDEIQRALAEGRNLERQRMALELHDNINAKIAATKWMIESLDDGTKPEPERRLIQSLVNQITEIYEDVRFISHNLVPKEIEDKSLAEILHDFVYNLNQNLRIQFELNISERLPALSNSHKLQAYSMIMELVNNVLKHSGSSKAWIDVDYSDERLKFRVRDDGKGFDPEANSNGTGLQNVLSRLESLDGTMRVENNAEFGADIIIEIPV